MRQLGELRDNAKETFRKHGVEVIAVFREEKEGKQGLEKIRKRAGDGFTLALDLNAKKTSRYSPGRMKFDSYIIGKDGRIIGIIDGSLRVRAQSDQIAKILEKANQ